MKWIVFIIVMFIGTLTKAGSVEIYNWPTAEGEAVISDKYRVFLTVGDDEEVELDVLMSDAKYKGDYREDKLKGRTFSFASISYSGRGDELTFRVEKTFGTKSDKVEIMPSRYGIIPKYTNNEATFSVNDDELYFSVHFKGNDNEVSGVKWIKHMLCIFIDPKESGEPEPDDDEVAVYSNDLPASELSNAEIIYFPAGYHNLKNYKNAGIIESDGTLWLKNQQSVYIQGGAFVEGLINRRNYSDSDQEITGRGILTGRQYYWHNHPDHTGKEYREIIKLGGNAKVEGIMVMESPNHGIVAQDTEIQNLKFLGWHCNNDAVRVGKNSEISNSFMRAVDDHFYNFDINVEDVVIWAGHNGAILTYGWGGKKDDNTYNSGASTLEDIDIIHPEWTGLGNNNGLVASQTGLDYQPFGYGGDTQTTVRNITIEGDIPGLVNLKPRSENNSSIIAVQVASNKVGYLGDLILENIKVNGNSGKSVIKGKNNASYNGNDTYFVKNVVFDNIKINGTYITEENKNSFFNIDNSTTKNIIFKASGNSKTELLKLHKSCVYPNPAHKKISVKSAEAIEHIIIVDQQGRKIINQTSPIVNIEELSSGIYFAIINHHETIKFIKR